MLETSPICTLHKHKFLPNLRTNSLDISTSWCIKLHFSTIENPKFVSRDGVSVNLRFSLCLFDDLRAQKIRPSSVAFNSCINSLGKGTHWHQARYGHKNSGVKDMGHFLLANYKYEQEFGGIEVEVRGYIKFGCCSLDSTIFWTCPMHVHFVNLVLLNFSNMFKSFWRFLKCIFSKTAWTHHLEEFRWVDCWRILRNQYGDCKPRQDRKRLSFHRSG